MKRIATLFLIIALSGATGVTGQPNEDLNNKVFQEHKGEILFSVEEVDPATANTGNFTNEFSLDDNIYAEIILKKTLARTFEDQNYAYNYDDPRYTYNYAVRVNVDGEPASQWLYEMAENYFDKSVSVEMVLQTDDALQKRENSDFINDWVKTIAGLTDGKHQISIEVVPLTFELIGSDQPVLARGEFTLKVENELVETYRDEKTTDLPPVTAVNPALEEDILVASEGVYPYSEPLRAYVTDVEQDWSYASDEFGNIRSRHIVASVIYENRTTNKCWVKSGLYYQRHQGYGDFGPLKHFDETEGYYDYQIPCRKVNEDDRTLTLND